MRGKILFLSLLLVIFLSGCVSRKNSTAKFAEQQMNLAGVQNVKIVKEGKEIEVDYSPTIVEYEDQIVAEWGAIFGVLSKTYPSAERYKIVQKIDGTTVATIIANASDVKAYSEGKIGLYELKNRIKLLGGDE